MTRDEYDTLPALGAVPCPDCGLLITEPNPQCQCPWIPSPLSARAFYLVHINRYHHNCERARSNVTVERRRQTRLIF